MKKKIKGENNFNNNEGEGEREEGWKDLLSILIIIKKEGKGNLGPFIVKKRWSIMSTNFQTIKKKLITNKGEKKNIFFNSNKNDKSIVKNWTLLILLTLCVKPLNFSKNKFNYIQ